MNIEKNIQPVIDPPKLKIAFLVVKHPERGGGIEKYTLELGHRLASRGHAITVYSMRHYGRRSPIVQGMQICYVPCIEHPFFEKLSASASAVIKILRNQYDYDVIHCHSVGSAAFAPILRLYNYKCLLQMHGIEWKRGRWGFIGKQFLRFLEAISIRSCNCFTAVSKTQCNFFMKNHKISMRYIPTGASIQARYEAKAILTLHLKPRRYILFASRLVPEKGAHYLIKAFRRIESDYHLVIAGDVNGSSAYKQYLYSLAKGDPRIIFPGFVEGQLLRELFSNAAVYVQPSEIEGLSISLLEAMSYGVCCLVSDIPENKEAIGDAGLTFKSGDISDLQYKISRIITSPNFDVSSGNKAISRVMQEYNWDDIASKFENLYYQLAENGR
jgi:glycosyltransferase involved in cell wall biosynthesis